MSASLGISVALLLAFAAFLSSHAALAYGLIRRQKPWWQALIVLLPITAWLAPYWGYQLGLRTRALLWVASLVGYIVALIAAYAAG